MAYDAGGGYVLLDDSAEPSISDAECQELIEQTHPRLRKTRVNENTERLEPIDLSDRHHFRAMRRSPDGHC